MKTTLRNTALAATCTLLVLYSATAEAGGKGSGNFAYKGLRVSHGNQIWHGSTNYAYWHKPVYRPWPVYTAPKVCHVTPIYRPVVVSRPRVIIERAPVVIQSAPIVTYVPQAPAAQPELARQQVMSGDTLTLQAGRLGNWPGRVLVKAGELSLKAEILDWNDDFAKVRLPSLDLDEAVPAELQIELADGNLAGTMAIEMAPAESRAASIRLTRDQR